MILDYRNGPSGTTRVIIRRNQRVRVKRYNNGIRHEDAVYLRQRQKPQPRNEGDLEIL